MTFQRDYLVRLPLPLAQLYSRSYNAKDARSRHDNTFYLAEALIKLAASPLVAAYLQECDQGSPRVELLDRLLRQLALPSLGQWLAMLRELARHFGSRVDAPSHPLGHLWAQLGDQRRDRPALLALYCRIKNGPDGQPGGEQSCSLLQLFDALVQYRNAVFGHGGPRFESFYAQEMGPLLFPAVNEVLAEDVLDLLGPRGSRLVYLTEMRTLDEERVEVGLRELVGLQGERLAPLTLSREQADGLVPGRVGVLWPGRAVPLRLDPLLVYRESETAEELLFLNRDRNGRQAEYLSYTTGRTERDRGMGPALAGLLSRVVRRPVSETELEALTEQSRAETTSTEALLAPAPPPGRVVADHELLAELGRGGMGVVYLARQQSLGRLVALKMLPADLAGDEVAPARFRREIRHLARCEHPGIVKVLSSGLLPDGGPYYTMEYVPGADLESVWREVSGSASGEARAWDETTWTRAVLSASRRRRQEMVRRVERTSSGGDPTRQDSPAAEPVEGRLNLLPLPPLPEATIGGDREGYVRRVVQLVRDAALALQAVHDQQVIHRDIKPANLMLTADGSRVVLMDFGLAKGQSLALTASKSAGFLGTLRYAAPEQLAAALMKVGPAADVRALGCVLWELLTRKRLFDEAEDEAQLASWVLSRDVPGLLGLVPGADRDLEAIVSRATERGVAERIGSARELAEYLGLYLEGKPLPIRPPTTSEMVWRWVRKRKGLVGTAAAALVLVVAVTVAAFVLVTRARDEALTLAGANARLADSERTARTNAETQQRRAEKGETEARAQKVQADRDRAKAEAIAHSFRLAAAQDAIRRGQPDEARTLLRLCDPRLCGWEYDFLLRQTRKLQLDLAGHPTQVTGVAFSPDGQYIASSAGGDLRPGELKVWDARTGQELRSFRGHPGPVLSVAFSPDGRHIASGEADGTVMLWDARTAQPVLPPFKGHTGPVNTVAFSADGKQIASGGNDGIVKVWDPRTGKEVASLTAHIAGVLSLSFSPEGKQIASGSFDRTATVWDIKLGREVHTLRGHTGPVAGVAFSPDGTRIATGSYDNTLKLWDAQTGKELFSLTGHTDGVTSLAFSADGSHIASGSSDKTIRVWDPRTGQLALTLKGHTQMVTGVAFSPDGRRVVSGGGVVFESEKPGEIKVWDAQPGQVIVSLGPHPDGVSGVAFSPDGGRIVSRTCDRTLQVWDAQSGQATLSLMRETSSWLANVAFSADGRRFLSPSHDKTVKVWDARTGEQILSLEGHTKLVASVAVSPDGKWIASGSWDSTVRVWDAQTGQGSRTLEGHTDSVYAAAFSPDSKRIVSGGGDRTVRVWDVQTGQEVLTLKGHAGSILGVAFSGDGKWIASAGEDHTVKVWDAQTGRDAFTLRGHTEAVTCLACSPDGRRIVSGSDDKTMKVWDIETGQEVLTLQGHASTVLSIAFSADGKRLVSGSHDRTVKVWDARPSPSGGQ